MLFQVTGDDRGLLQVSAEQRQELDRGAQSRTLPGGDVFRARIVLALAAIGRSSGSWVPAQRR